MKNYNLRLKEIWSLLPECQLICLRVETTHGCFYIDRTIYRDECPYERQYAIVKSIYADAREVVTITIQENMPHETK